LGTYYETEKPRVVFGTTPIVNQATAATRWLVAGYIGRPLRRASAPLRDPGYQQRSPELALPSTLQSIAT
jgi:hypothetical protein